MIENMTPQEKHNALVKELATKIGNSKSIKFKSNTLHCLRKKDIESESATYIETDK